jgi:hypothetical protein
MEGTVMMEPGFKRRGRVIDDTKPIRDLGEIAEPQWAIGEKTDWKPSYSEEIRMGFAHIRDNP